eukprot:8202419-Heterocapsa_arctica.AAC.1
MPYICKGLSDTVLQGALPRANVAEQGFRPRIFARKTSDGLRLVLVTQECVVQANLRDFPSG